MKLTDEEKNAIVKIRLEQAKDTFSEVKIHIGNELWRTAVNRLYYACFYATNALMVHFGYQTNTHSGLKGLFGLHFVKTGIISDDIGFVLSALFDMRHKGDYDIWVDIKPQTVLSLLEPTRQFIETIEKLIYNNDIQNSSRTD